MRPWRDAGAPKPQLLARGPLLQKVKGTILWPLTTVLVLRYPSPFGLARNIGQSSYDFLPRRRLHGFAGMPWPLLSGSSKSPQVRHVL